MHGEGFTWRQDKPFSSKEKCCKTAPYIIKKDVILMNDFDMDEIAVKATGRPKGSKDSHPRPGRTDLSRKGNDEMTLANNSNYIDHVQALASLPAIDIKDIKQVRERMNLYLDFCKNDGVKPTVSGLALAIGVDRRTLYRWRVGDTRNAEYQELIARYVNMLETYLETQMVSGKINPVTGIFLAKNHFGYADKQEVEVLPSGSYGINRELTEEELSEKYLSSIPEE